VRLGAAGNLSRVEVDTAFFKGNFPESCSLEVCTAPRDLTDADALGNLPWKEILTRTKLKADSLHVYEKELLDSGEITHVRFHIYPDGGVARLRIFGTTAQKAT
jgi:allantoicase